MRRTWVWWIGATALLAGGFALYLVLVFAVERPPDPEAAQELRTALSVYGRLVLVKGLLPALWIALALAGGLERRFPDLTRSRARRAGVYFGCAGLAVLAIASTLLRADIPGSPRVVFSGPANFARTWLEMSTAAAAAMWLPRVMLRSLR